MTVFDTKRVKKGKVFAPDPADGDGFGVSTAIVGSTVIAGAKFDNGEQDRMHAGSAYVVPMWCAGGYQSESATTCCPASCGMCSRAPGGGTKCCAVPRQGLERTPRRTSLALLRYR